MWSASVSVSACVCACVGGLAQALQTSISSCPYWNGQLSLALDCTNLFCCTGTALLCFYPASWMSDARECQCVDYVAHAWLVCPCPHAFVRFYSTNYASI